MGGKREKELVVARSVGSFVCWLGGWDDTQFGWGEGVSEAEDSECVCWMSVSLSGCLSLPVYSRPV